MPNKTTQEIYPQSEEDPTTKKQELPKIGIRLTGIYCKLPNSLPFVSDCDLVYNC